MTKFDIKYILASYIVFVRRCVVNKDRVIDFANYVIENNATIRKTASVFGYSKSTVHNDIQKKLKKINSQLYYKVKKILQNNFCEKHLRGGESTRQKYLKLKK